MSSTSQKHRNFVAEPMGEKPVTELAGVGEVLGGRLSEAGFDKAYVVLGQFLVLKKDKELFVEWMKETCSANVKQSADCFQCLKDWCDEFLEVVERGVLRLDLLDGGVGGLPKMMYVSALLIVFNLLCFNE